MLKLPPTGNTSQQISDIIGGKDGFDKLVSAIKEGRPIIACYYDESDDYWHNTHVNVDLKGSSQVFLHLTINATTRVNIWLQITGNEESYNFICTKTKQELQIKQ